MHTEKINEQKTQYFCKKHRMGIYKFLAVCETCCMMTCTDSQIVFFFFSLQQEPVYLLQPVRRTQSHKEGVDVLINIAFAHGRSLDHQSVRHFRFSCCIYYFNVHV